MARSCCNSFWFFSLGCAEIGSADVIAGFRSDFQTGGFPDRWEYLWNAPDGWLPGGSSGALSTGWITETNRYQTMIPAGTIWTADGETDGSNSFPDRYVRLTSTGGHPGSYAGEVFGGESNRADRYAIAAYTVAANGYYAITDSFVSKGSLLGDGVEAVVHINGPPNEYDWMARIRDLEHEAEIRGLDFGIINNNPVGTNTYDFYKKALKYIDEYVRPPYNGSPALWAPWSWYNSPKHFSPECSLIGAGEYSYTIGVLANAIIEQIKPKEDVIGCYWGFTPTCFGTVQDWKWKSIVPPVLEDGFLKTVATGTDAQIYRDDVFLDGSIYRPVEVAVAVGGGTYLRLCYQVNGGSVWYEAPAINLNTDGQTHVYSFNLLGCSPWNDETVTSVQLRLTDVVGVSCWLDYLWIAP